MILGFSCFLLFLAIFTVVPPPINLLWKISILVKEWGYFFAIFCALYTGVLYLNFGLNLDFYLVSTAGLLYIFPLFNYLFYTRILNKKLENSFLANKKQKLKINFLTLLKGSAIRKPICHMLDYSDSRHIKHSLHFYPPIKNYSPCVIVVHGGAWDSGDSTQLSTLNRWLVQEGYAVASLNYRLAPEHTFETQLADILSAKDYLKANADILHIDAKKLAYVGRSAGGQLVLMAAARQADENVKGIVSFYAPADLVWGYSKPGNPLILNSRKVLSAYIGDTAIAQPELYKAASANYQLDSKFPPTLQLHGRADVMVAYEHTRRMEQKLTEHQVPHFSADFPLATHGFDFAFNGPGSQLSNQLIKRFLNKVFNQN